MKITIRSSLVLAIAATLAACAAANKSNQPEITGNLEARESAPTSAALVKNEPRRVDAAKSTQLEESIVVAERKQKSRAERWRSN